MENLYANLLVIVPILLTSLLACIGRKKELDSRRPSLPKERPSDDVSAEGAHESASGSALNVSKPPETLVKEKDKKDESAKTSGAAAPEPTPAVPVSASDQNKTGDKKSEAQPDKDSVLDGRNEHIAFLMEHGEETLMPGEFESHCRQLADQSAIFLWAMRKHMSSDESSWRHMSKKIALMRIEGFDTRVNTRKAREKKAMAAKTETKIDAVFNKNQPKSQLRKKKND